MFVRGGTYDDAMGVVEEASPRVRVRGIATPSNRTEASPPEAIRVTSSVLYDKVQ